MKDAEMPTITPGFVSEAIRPVAGSFDAAAMVRGEPGVPRAFDWRGRRWQVAAVEESWKTTGPCRNGSREKYVRRHWARVRTESGVTVTLYVDRQPRDRKKRRRWWLFTVDTLPEQGL